MLLELLFLTPNCVNNTKIPKSFDLKFKLEEIVNCLNKKISSFINHKNGYFYKNSIKILSFENQNKKNFISIFKLKKINLIQKTFLVDP